MSARKRGLGRGLEALLGAGAEASPAPSGDTVEALREEEQASLKDLPVEFLQRGKYQPRRDMDPESLQELADSIRAQGVMQPIVVRRIGDNRYEIIAGERRWRAAQLAELPTVPAVIKDVTDEAAIAMALIENIQREDLNPIEEAVALQRLQREFSLTQQEVARAVGKSRSTVANLLRLMALQEDVRLLLERGDLEMGHARALLALEGGSQSQAARTVVGKGLSVRQTEELVRRLQRAAAEAPVSANQSVQDPDIRRLQEDLSQKLGASVQIQHGARGKGKLVLSYNSLDELDGILSHIR
ncbi:ParB/RepB/Spo0J family partition protein [Haliea atlantica]